MTQILTPRGNEEHGDMSVRPRITPKPEPVGHQLAESDHLAARPGAESGIHLLPVQGSDQEDPDQALQGSRVFHSHAKH